MSMCVLKEEVRDRARGHGLMMLEEALDGTENGDCGDWKHHGAAMGTARIVW